MEKIGKPALVLLNLFCLACLFTSALYAQPSVTVTSSVTETTVFTGERITLSVEISGDFNNVSRPDLPDFPGFRLLSNSPSTSRSYSFVNGKTSTSYTYSYYLIAQEKGNYQIPPISVNIDNKEYTTDPIGVKIVDRNSSADNSASGSRPEVFLQLKLSQKHPVPGQQLIADIILYFKDGMEVNSYQPVPGWKAEGFWKEELTNAARPQATSVILNGIRYRKARLLQFALFPTKSGKLTISPYQIIVTVRSSSSRSDPFSSFFGGFGTNQRQVELKTDPLSITVNPLPAPTNSNAIYTGAVGNFTISRSISTTKAMVGESVEIKTTIKGTGNVPLISKPDYKLPKQLEVYQPQESSNVSRSNQRISGTKTFTDIVIARSPGSYTIPATTLSWFNPSARRYEHKELPALSLTAEPNPDAAITNNQPLAFSVTPVTGLAEWLIPTHYSIYDYWWFWAGLIIPAIILGVAYRQKSYHYKMSSDTAFARSIQADEKAKEQLQRAIEKSEQGHIKEAYNLLQKALTGFIGDRLNLPEAGLSIEGYISALEKQQVDPNLIKNVRMLLDKCATISYAPDTSHAYLKSHVGLAQSILEKLKKVL